MVPTISNPSRTPDIPRPQKEENGLPSSRAWKRASNSALIAGARLRQLPSRLPVRRYPDPDPLFPYPVPWQRICHDFPVT